MTAIASSKLPSPELSPQPTTGQTAKAIQKSRVAISFLLGYTDNRFSKRFHAADSSRRRRQGTQTRHQASPKPDDETSSCYLALMEARGRRRFWVLMTLALIATVILGVPLVLAPALIPSGLVYAPNSKRSPEPEPNMASLRRLGVSAALRVPVGPPPAELSVWILPPRKDSGPARAGTVLVLHGIRDSKRSMLGWGRRIAEAGFCAVMVDLRGQGNSAGPFLTYGVVERRDLQQLLDVLLSRGLVAPPFAAFGASYGGATAIQLAGIDRRIAAVVAVAPFADLRSVVPTYLRRYLPGLWRLVPLSRVRDAVDRAGVMAGFDPDQASPRLLVQSARAQVMIIHGAEDQKIPPWHSELIRAQAPRRVDRLVIPGRDHDSIMGDPVTSKRALEWLQRWLVPHP